MKKENTTIVEHYQALTQELYRAFDHFNKVFANGKLITPIITIQSTGRMRAYGWYGKEFWQEGQGEKQVLGSEINLSAEYLNRGTEETLQTLLHEMAHLKNAQDEVVDCSASQYHNAKFKIAAEGFGLIVEKIRHKGFAKTSLGDKAKEAIASLKPKEEAFKVSRKEMPSRYKKKYATFITDLDYEDRVAEAADNAGMTKKELVEEALEAYLKNVE